MRKILVVCALMLSSTVLQATPSLTVENTLHNAAANLVQVPITIFNDSNVANVQFDLVYPAGAVEAVAAFPGAAITPPVTDPPTPPTHMVDAQLISTTAGNDRFRVIVVAQTANLVDRRFAAGALLKIPFLVNSSLFNRNVPVYIQNVIATNENGDSGSIAVNAFDGLIITPNDTTTDSDGDGIADSIELAYGTNPVTSDGVLIPNGTPLAGLISQDSVLAPGGVYPVTANLEIAAGARLTIYQGTTLRFNSGTGLTVNGELQILGTGNVLTSSLANPYMGSWNGVTVMASATNVVINGATIEWASYGIYFNNASGEVHHSTLRNNVVGIYVYQTSHPVITDGNEIINNSTGIYVYGKRLAGLDPHPVINRNRIYDNTNYNLMAFYFYNASQTVLDATENWWGSDNITDIVATIYDNIDHYSAAPKVKFVQFQDVNGGLTDGNAIGGEYGIPVMVNGRTYHALDTVTIATGQTLDIPGNVTILFYGTAREEVHALKLQVDGSLNVAGSAAAPVTFRSYKDNASWGSWKGIEVGSGATSLKINGAIIKDAHKGISFNDTYSLINNLTGDVSNSRIENNIKGIFISGNSRPFITNGNVITLNSVGITVQSNYSLNTAPVITYNNIYNNSNNNFMAYAFITNNVSSIELDATYNWWGTVDASVIESTITDYIDNPGINSSSPYVIYRPYLDAEGGNPMGVPGS